MQGLDFGVYSCRSSPGDVCHRVECVDHALAHEVERLAIGDLVVGHLSSTHLSRLLVPRLDGLVGDGGEKAERRREKEKRE